MAVKKKSGKRIREGTKERFLAAAEEIFAKKGFKGTTTREIADQVGVNISSLHFHWHSKENLYLEILRRNYGELKDTISKWDIDSGSTRLRTKRSPVEMISSFVGDLVDFAIRKKNFVRIMVHRWLQEDRVYREVEREMMAPLANMASSRIRLVLKKGLEKETDPDHITINFLWIVIGYITGGPLHGLIIGEDIESQETRETIKRHLIHMALRIFGLKPLKE
jgi:TetR/AcrR family transcriptional regulator